MINNPYQIQNNGYPMQYNPYNPYNLNPSGLQRCCAPEETVQPRPQYQQNVGLNGRIVPGIDNINANEVPMDGSMAFFPNQDMTEIYAKRWDADGRIKTVVYTPRIEPEMSQTINCANERENSKIDLLEDVRTAFCERLDVIESKLDELVSNSDKLKAKTTSARTKKETDI